MTTAGEEIKEEATITDNTNKCKQISRSDRVKQIVESKPWLVALLKQDADSDQLKLCNSMKNSFEKKES